jgi:hypothetical protein
MIWLYFSYVLDVLNFKLKSNYNLFNGTPFSNSYYYNKIKGHLVTPPNAFLVLISIKSAYQASALFDLVFTNISDFGVSI